MRDRHAGCVLTLLTDFGNSQYVGQMKGVIHRIQPDARIVDITHQVGQGQIKEGAFLLWASVPYFPKDAVHVGVVDPGVGTDRAPILVTTKQGSLVGPDNGLLIPAARRLGLLEVVEATNEELFLPDVSHTFHGRDIFAPVAAHVARGATPDEVGVVADGFIEEALKAPVLDDRIRGEVLHVDHFGNVVTSIWHEDLDAHVDVGDAVPLDVAGKDEEVPRVHTFDDVEDATAGLIVGSTGFIELVVHDGSAAELFGLEVGDGIHAELG